MNLFILFNKFNIIYLFYTGLTTGDGFSNKAFGSLIGLIGIGET